METDSAVVRAYLLDVIGKGEAEALERLVDPGFVNHDPPAGMPTDRDGLRAIVAFLHGAIDGLTVEIDEIREAQFGWVEVEARMRGRLTRPLFGHAANEDVTFPIVDRIAVAGGRVVERRES